MRKLTKQYKTAVIILSFAIIVSIFILNIHNITNLPKTIQNWHEEYKYEKMTEQLWEEKMKEIEQREQLALPYINEQIRLAEEIEKLLKKDHYGGKTPEETLALFIEALKNKNYKLAAKYYLPWQWEEKEEWLKEYVNHPASERFIKAYEKQYISRDPHYVFGVKLYIKEHQNDKYPYRIKFIKNNETGVWKIEEF